MFGTTVLPMRMSPPSRAAWIEIRLFGRRLGQCQSPPSRAAWIEMALGIAGGLLIFVAAFTGGVD